MNPKYIIIGLAAVIGLSMMMQKPKPDFGAMEAQESQAYSEATNVVPDPEGPMGLKGLGEHVLIPTAPAILNAIRHATGAKVTKLPALPHRVLAAIREAQE